MNEARKASLHALRRCRNALHVPKPRFICRIPPSHTSTLVCGVPSIALGAKEGTRVFAPSAGRGNRGFTARQSPRLAPSFSCRKPPRGRFAPRGEKPLRFSPHPFFGVGEKRKRLYSFLHYSGLREIAAANLQRQFHSRPYCSGALGFLTPSRPAGSGKASLAPCALAGDPLAQSVCGQRMCAVVTNRGRVPAGAVIPVSAALRLLRYTPFPSVCAPPCTSAGLPSVALAKKGGLHTRPCPP